MPSINKNPSKLNSSNSTSPKKPIIKAKNSTLSTYNSHKFKTAKWTNKKHKNYSITLSMLSTQSLIKLSKVPTKRSKKNQLKNHSISANKIKNQLKYKLKNKEYKESNKP